MNAAKEKELIEIFTLVVESCFDSGDGEIICKEEDFARLEKFIDGLTNGKTHKEQMQPLSWAGT